MAYRKLALKWHPDKNREEGAAEMFKQITEACTCQPCPSSLLVIFLYFLTVALLPATLSVEQTRCSATPSRGASTTSSVSCQGDIRDVALLCVRTSVCT